MKRADKLKRFGRGPWLTEPDALCWLDGTYPCHLRRHVTLGTLCGYVGVLQGHPAYGMSADELEEHLGELPHGGITYYAEGGLVAPGEPRGVWWLGFDANHFGDLIPMADAREARTLGKTTARYRDVAFMRRECAQLVEALDVLMLRARHGA